MVRVIVAADQFLSREYMPSSSHHVRFVPALDPAAVAGALADAGALVVRRLGVTEAMMLSGPGLKLVQQVGVGVERIDLGAAGRLGIRVANTGGAVTTAVVEHAFLLLLAAMRGLLTQNDALRRGDWSSPEAWESQELADSTVGMVGFGAIGRGIVRRLLAFDARVLVSTRTAPPVLPEGARLADLDRLLQESDAVVLAVPLTNETLGMVGPRELALMKPSAVLINVARGAVVDELALIRALEAGRLRAAGLDVFAREPLPLDSPLRRLPNVVGTPHYAGASQASRARTWNLVMENLDRLEASEPLLNLVHPGA